jgi:poly(3-hydroxybutyrate) depolymerase
VFAAPDKLPAYGADARQVSVSGLSSGAFMAVQLQVAYSSRIVGAGIVAGGPYYCAANNEYFVGICMGQLPFFTPNPMLMARFAQDFARAGSIDPLVNLRKRRVYVYSGTEDRVVRPPAVGATVAFFRQVGVDGSRLKYVNTLPSGHAMITPAAGNECAANAPPFINHCSVDGTGYDQAGALLQHLHGPLQPPVAAPAGQLLRFDQRAFAAQDTGLSDTAFLYVPQTCSATGARCKVHVALHGCVQSAESVGDKFVKEAGYNRWADSNRMLVLYPQVDKSSVPSNPQGCWDWWGYTGGDYAKKAAPQMKAIMAMVDRLLQRP